MTKFTNYDIIRSPVVTEKSTLASEHGQIVFDVAVDATKSDIKVAIEQIFGVNVKAVNVVNVKGKSKAFKFRQGRRGDWRKAYVTLADGQSIDVMMTKA